MKNIQERQSDKFSLKNKCAVFFLFSFCTASSRAVTQPLNLSRHTFSGRQGVAVEERRTVAARPQTELCFLLHRSGHTGECEPSDWCSCSDCQPPQEPTLFSEALLANRIVTLYFAVSTNAGTAPDKKHGMIKTQIHK